LEFYDHGPNVEYFEKGTVCDCNIGIGLT